MTTLPVVWVSKYPEVLARGTWDGALIEALIDRSLWRVPGGFAFEHHEVKAGDLFPTHLAGGLLVISGRNHAADFDWINEQVKTWEWCLFLVLGDEAAEFPWRRLHARRKAVWAQGAFAERHRGVDVPLGSGFPPWFRAGLPTTWPRKSIDVFLAGQNTHARREQCFDALDALAQRDDLTVKGVATRQFTAGLPPQEYAEFLAQTKIAPCPSGPESPDSFRLYEALEAGCIPLADIATRHGPQPAYWTYLFGEPVPFPEVQDWHALPAVTDELLAGWPANANRVGAWWAQVKRRYAWRLHTDLCSLTGITPSLTAAEEITAVITTSPAPLHPSTEHLAATIASVRHHLPHAEIVLAVDGVRPEHETRRGDYDEYVRRIVWACLHEWTNVVPVVKGEWVHQANLLRAALGHVKTPLVLFMEHDTPLVAERDIDWTGLVGALHDGTANVVRLHHEASVHPDHAHLMLDTEPKNALLRTVQWSQRPHLARTLWYQRTLDRYFTPEARGFVEDVLHGVIQSAWLDHGEPGWEEWRLVLYAPEGSMQRSLHLDSRGNDPKHGQVFAYPGGGEPPGAPRAGPH